MNQQLEDIFNAYRVTEYVSDPDGTIGFRDLTDDTSIWFRLIRGSYYFDGRLPLDLLKREGNLIFSR